MAIFVFYKNGFALLQEVQYVETLYYNYAVHVLYGSLKTDLAHGSLRLIIHALRHDIASCWIRY